MAECNAELHLLRLKSVRQTWAQTQRGLERGVSLNVRSQCKEAAVSCFRQPGVNGFDSGGG